MFIERTQDNLSSNDKQKAHRNPFQKEICSPPSATADRKYVLFTQSVSEWWLTPSVPLGPPSMLTVSLSTPLVQLKGTFLLLTNWQTDPRLVFICLCILIYSEANAKRERGKVLCAPLSWMRFINLLNPGICEKTIVYSWAFHFLTPSLGAKMEQTLTWEGQLNVYRARLGAWVSPSTYLRGFFLTLGIIYILKELKEHLPGFWRHEFSCKLCTVWATDSRVVVDNWILRLAERLAHHHCRYNWSSPSSTTPLPPRLTVCCWHTMHV